MSISEDDAAQFNAHLAALEEAWGAELTDEGYADLADHIQANGFTPESVEQGVAQIMSEAGVEAPAAEDYTDYTEEDYNPLVEQDYAAQMQEQQTADAQELLNHDVAAGLEDLQAKLGRKLTVAEVTQLGERAERNARGGHGIDLETAFEEATGGKPTSQWTPNDWAQHAATQYEDAKKLERGESFEPPTHEEQVAAAESEGVRLRIPAFTDEE